MWIASLLTLWDLSMPLLIIICLIFLKIPWTADSAKPLRPYVLSMKSYTNSQALCRSLSCASSIASDAIFEL